MQSTLLPFDIFYGCLAYFVAKCIYSTYDIRGSPLEGVGINGFLRIMGNFSIQIGVFIFLTLQLQLQISILQHLELFARVTQKSDEKRPKKF
jgi:hypothetical protein